MKSIIKLIAVFGVALFSLSGCLEEVSPDILSGEQLIVINGVITNEEGPYYVRVTRSNTTLMDFTTNDATGAVTLKTNGSIVHEPVTDAIVTITDNLGNVDELELSKMVFSNAAQAETWGEFGFYETTTDLRGTPGRSYTLSVKVDGEEYTSTANMLPTPPELTEVNFELRTLNDGQAVPYEIPSVSFSEPQGVDNYYRFAYWDHDPRSANTISQNLRTMLFDDVLIVDDEFLKPEVEDLSFADAIVEGQSLDPIFEKEANIFIYNIERDVFKYYQSLQSQIRNDGGAFSPAPASPPSNISNGALGFWQASSFSSKVAQLPDRSPSGGGGGGEPGTGIDPNFNIVSHADEGLTSFNRKIVVFGIDIYAAPEVEESKLFHAANVMAQYLDNDEDGNVDDQALLDKMLEDKPFLVMWKNESDLNIDPPQGRIGQDLGNDETNPSFVTDGMTGEFDAALEEVLHLINQAGHSEVYPDAFGLKPGSDLANAMDIARGGRFLTVPDTYPENAWYTYDDETCEYGDCQTIEYLYWALTSMLGAQEKRLNEIGNEWRLNTREKVENTDKAIFELLTNPIYKMPTVLPDGTYRR